jgi:uncharacterized protein (DUF2236 family)
LARRLQENGWLFATIFTISTTFISPLFAGELSAASDKAAPVNSKQIASVTGVSRPASARKAATSVKLKAVANGSAANPESGLQALMDAHALAAAGRLVPPSVQEAADLGCETARKLMRKAAVNLSQCGQWLVSLEQQLNSAPVATPAGPPYITRSIRHLRLMPDGRIKTVVPN